MKCTVKILRLMALVMLVMTPLLAYSQNITVTGSVLDEAGDPLIGATVQQKGSGNGIATDIDGNFKLSVPKNATLVISYVGYTTQSVAVDGRTNITVTLKENAEVLDEVVVVGYGQMKRSDMTGSVVSVGDAAIKKSVPTSIDQVLQARGRCEHSGQLRYSRRVDLHPHPRYQLAQRDQPAYLRNRRCCDRLRYRR